MAQFEVTRVGDGFEAECRELGVLIRSVRLANIKETARRTAARANSEAEFTFKKRASLAERFRNLLRRWDRGVERRR